MIKQIFITLGFALLLACSLLAQNTVGLLSYDPDQSQEGYNLIYPHNQEKVFLLDNCGELVHVWPGDPDYRPGNTAYILENGNLVKTKRYFVGVNDPIWAGGGGAIVEIVDWDDNILWSFEQNDSLRRLHHDICPMPNGNILMVSWELRTYEEVVEAGRDTSILLDGELWPDYVLEVNPATDEIIWEWHAWDHLIQDHDPEKDNYGEVGDHPELIDINWTNNPDGNADWMHVNAIDYNEELDQIMLSVPTFHEVWIIDHSTTTEEAAGHTGGLSGKGGDLLYRWGNPQTYRAGSQEDQKLFFQHDTHWIDEFVDSSHPHFGKIAVFNNRFASDYSAANVIDPAFNEGNWEYSLMSGNWLPEDYDLTIIHPEPTKVYSTGLSSVQFLDGGNTLICAGRLGYSVELSEENEIVWEYKTPIIGGNPVAQGDTIENGNQTFRMKRYPLDYQGFDGHDLSPIGYIELDPDTTFCDLILPVETVYQNSELSIFPNPAINKVVLDYHGFDNVNVQIFDISGNLKTTLVLTGVQHELDVTSWSSGMYFIVSEEFIRQKLVIIK